MTHLLPPNLLKLFDARQPVPYLKPVARDRSLPLNKQLSGVAAILQDLKEQTALKDAEDEANAAEDSKDKLKDASKGQVATATAKASTSTVKVEDAMQEDDVKPSANSTNGDVAAKDVDMEEGEEPDADDSKKATVNGETTGLTYTEGEKLRQRVAERKRKREEDFKQALKEFDPTKDEKAAGDAYKTLFISRLSYRATEDDLRKEFGYYGSIERIRIVRVENGKKKGKSRGYAFILYESERDMKAAYKDADGLKIDGRRILVDVERGRTVKGWRPRRLGGGLGGRTKPAAPAQPTFGISTYGNNPGGGFRGGRGGFGGRGGGFSGRGGFNDRGPPRGGGVGFGGGFSRGPPANAGGNSGFGGGQSGGFQNRDGPPQQANSGSGGFNQRAMIGQQSGSGWGSRAAPGVMNDSSSQTNNYPARGDPAGYSRGGASEFEVPRQPQSSGGSYGGSNTGGGYGNRDSRDSGGYRDSRDRDDRGDNKRARY